VLIGANDPADSIFEIRQPGGAPPWKITGFSGFLPTTVQQPEEPVH
jgi:hypothetical protein